MTVADLWDLRAACGVVEPGSPKVVLLKTKAAIVVATSFFIVLLRSVIYVVTIVSGLSRPRHDA